MPFHDIAQLASKEFFPGFTGHPVHTEGMTVMYWTIEQGATIPEHQHVHEQLTYVLEGAFDMTVDGERREMTAGQFTTIPSNILHHGTALTPCKLLDVFIPVRQDYRL